MGTASKITPTGVLTTLWTFCSQPDCPDGAFPSPLIQGADGNFYGTTSGGGLVGQAYANGTIFKITPGGTLTTLYAFCPTSSYPKCEDGALPNAPLIQADNGNFYGTTTAGGPSCAIPTTCGTVFEFTPGGAVRTLYGFCSQPNCADGGGPIVGLAEGH